MLDEVSQCIEKGLLTVRKRKW